MINAEKKISVVYRLSIWLSLGLMILATLEFIVSGDKSIVVEKFDTILLIKNIFHGNYYATYLLAIIILIFSPGISLIIILISFLFEKKWNYALLVSALIIIMSIGVFLKTGR